MKYIKQSLTLITTFALTIFSYQVSYGFTINNPNARVNSLSYKYTNIIGNRQAKGYTNLDAWPIYDPRRYSNRGRVLEIKQGGTDKLLSLLKYRFPDWTFLRTGNLEGSFDVQEYAPCIPNFPCGNYVERVGSYFRINYNPKPFSPDPIGANVHWIQRFTDNLDIAVIDDLDILPFQSNPYYDTYGVADSTFFLDIPSTTEFDRNNFFYAETYLVEEIAPKTVKIYNGVRWGWENIISPSLDLAFVFDTTGSMDNAINDVKNSATEIATKIFGKIPDSRVSIVDYQDQYPNGDEEDYPYNAVLPFSDSLTDVSSAINRLTLGYGGDIPETAYTALMNTLQGNQIGGWREDAEKAIILFTDAPPHDPEPSTGYTLDDVVNASKNPFILDIINPNSLVANNTTTKPISIYTVLSGDNKDALNIFSQLSKQTGGNVYQSTDIIDSIFDAITDIQEDISDPDPQSVPESSNLLALFILGLIGIGKCRKV